MRSYLLILLAFLCQNIHAQILPGMARMEGFNPYRPVNGKLEFSPDSINPESVREFDSTGRCVRHAQVVVKKGVWYIHGIDSVWGFFSESVFTVIENIPHGPFHTAYQQYLGEDWLQYAYSGEYRNGLIQGKLRGENATFFNYENGRLHGPYIYQDYRRETIEKGRYKNGYREGKVLISYDRKKTETLIYVNGYLQSIEFHHNKNTGKYYPYPYDVYSRFEFFSDTLTNTLEVIKYGLQGDMAEIQQHFGAIDIRNSQVYENNEVLESEYRRVTFDKPQRLRIENYLICNEELVGVYAKQIRSFFDDGSSYDSLYRLNSTLLEYYKDRKNNEFYFDDNGILSKVRFSYQTYHNPITCLYGLKDSWGEWVLRPEYEEIYMGGGHFIVKKDGRYGLHKWNGEVSLAPELDNLRHLRQDGYSLPIGIFTSNFSLLTSDLYLAENKGKWGLCDQNGIWIIEALYDQISASDSFVSTRIGKELFLWKLEQGNFIQFNQAFQEIDLYQIPFLIKTGQKKGILGSDFTWIIPPEYEEIEIGNRLYVGEKRVEHNQRQFWVLNDKGEQIHKEPLIGRPILRGDFVELLGKHSSRGIMTNQGKLLAEPEYSNIRYLNFKTKARECLSRVYCVDINRKYYLIDTNGNRSDAYDKLSVISPDLERNSWNLVYTECPRILAFVAIQDNQYRIIDHHENTLVDSEMLGTPIDTIWVRDALAFVNTSDTLHLYVLDSKGLFKLSPANVSKRFDFAGIRGRGNECVVLFNYKKYGLIDSRTGAWLLKPEYQQIEKRGEVYVLQDARGKISFYKRGEDISWQKQYALRYPMDTVSFIVYTHAGKAGLMNAKGKLLIDTLYQSMVYQTYNSYIWYWAEKAETGVWDIYNYAGTLMYQDIQATSGNVLDSGDLIITRKDGKMLMLNPQMKELIKADQIIYRDYKMQEFYFQEGKYWGKYNRSGLFSHPALYEKVWPTQPFYVMDMGIPGQLDSAGNLIGTLDLTSFLNTPLPRPGHKYFQFCESVDFEKLEGLNCSSDSLSLWQSNLLFMLRTHKNDLTDYSATPRYGLQFKRVLISGETKEIPTTVHIMGRFSGEARYKITGYISLASKQVLSTFFIRTYLDGTDFRKIETHTYAYQDDVLTKLTMARIVKNETMLETLLLQELAKKNLPIKSCPNLKFVYALSKDRFFLDEYGITFLIELSQNHIDLPVKIPYTDMMDILRKESPVYSLARGE